MIHMHTKLNIEYFNVNYRVLQMISNQRKILPQLLTGISKHIVANISNISFL